MNVNECVLDTLPPRSVAAPRRRSLLLLGGAAAVAVAGRRPVRAVTKAKKRCTKEMQQCRRFLQGFCEGIPPARRLDSLLPCCATCKVGAGLKCVLEAM